VVVPGVRRGGKGWASRSPGTLVTVAPVCGHEGTGRAELTGLGWLELPGSGGKRDFQYIK
jgi:hypothetical protein